MKRQSFLLRLFAIMTLPLVWGESFAQLPDNVRFYENSGGATVSRKAGIAYVDETDSKSVRIGYCGDRNGGTLSPQVATGPLEYKGAVQFPPRILKKYAGDKIDKVEFYLASSNVDAVNVFVTKDLYGQPLSSKLLRPGNFTDGWNTVTLNKPVEITGNEDLYVGYSIMVQDVVDPKMGLTFEYLGSNTVMYGYNWYSLNQGADSWNTADPIDRNISIRAYASGDNSPLADVGLNSTDLSDFLYEEKPTDINLKVRNYSGTPVNSVEYEVKSNGESIFKGIQDGLDVPPFTEDTIFLQGVNIGAAGNHNVILQINKVNGIDDSDVSDNTYQKDVFVIKNGAVEQPRKVLIEQFTSENSKNIPVADEVYSGVIDVQPDVVWIKHHIGGDKYVLPDATSRMLRFFNNESEGPFVPAIMGDRTMFNGLQEVGPTYFIPGASTLSSFIEGLRYMPSYVNITPTVKVSDNGSSVDIHVEGTSEMTEMPFQEGLRMNVLLVEDNIESNDQAGSDGTYINNGVIRAFVAGVDGDPLDLSQLSYSKDYTATIDKSWNISNMRVVTFISSFSEDVTKNTVYNAAQVSIDNGTSGIVSVTDNAADNPLVWYDGFNVQVSSGYSIAGVYDMSGAKLDSKGSLSKGLYIVSVEKDGVHKNLKLMVRK